MRARTAALRTLPTIRFFSVLSLVLLGLFGLGCRGRFPGCESDQDCKKLGDGRDTCFEKRCIQCRYDPDCEPLGSNLVCNTSTNTCETVGGGKPQENPSQQGDGGAVDGEAGDSGAASGTEAPPVDNEPAAAPTPAPPPPKASAPSVGGRAKKKKKK